MASAVKEMAAPALVVFTVVVDRDHGEEGVDSFLPVVSVHMSVAGNRMRVELAMGKVVGEHDEEVVFFHEMVVMEVHIGVVVVLAAVDMAVYVVETVVSLVHDRGAVMVAFHEVVVEVVHVEEVDVSGELEVVDAHIEVALVVVHTVAEDACIEVVTGAMHVAEVISLVHVHGAVEVAACHTEVLHAEEMVVRMVVSLAHDHGAVKVVAGYKEVVDGHKVVVVVAVPVEEVGVPCELEGICGRVVVVLVGHTVVVAMAVHIVVAVGVVAPWEEAARNEVAVLCDEVGIFCDRVAYVHDEVETVVDLPAVEVAYHIVVAAVCSEVKGGLVRVRVVSTCGAATYQQVVVVARETVICHVGEAVAAVHTAAEMVGYTAVVTARTEVEMVGRRQVGVRNKAMQDNAHLVWKQWQGSKYLTLGLPPLPTNTWLPDKLPSSCPSSFTSPVSRCNGRWLRLYSTGDQCGTGRSQSWDVCLYLHLYAHDLIYVREAVFH
ncbi:hypothetical protein OPV22_031720 [Ensete ventricosum]|uniref:Uncharacterized protein n=1 Tax=Ensete ventricosum TaxID=4639 RepID=A0AAV8PPP0_ENSVE|nr:hypothetical protein OPV22_031720 [Ensete ventricosum]